MTRESAWYSAEPPLPAHPAPPDGWPMPELPPIPEPKVAPRARMAGAFTFLGAAIAMVGALLPWARYTDGYDLSGTHHGNGWMVLVVGVIAAGLAGAVWVGSSHPVVRFGIAGCAVALALMFLWNRARIQQADSNSRIGPITTGGGLLLVGLAAFVMAAGALLALGPMKDAFHWRIDEPQRQG
jgi:hypothetical protein